MWFNNALVFQFELDEDIDWTDAFIPDALKPCPPHARAITGWSNVCDDELVQEVAGCALISFGKEERILPRAVIKRVLAERVLKMEVEQSITIKRSQKSRMADELEFELLPKAFCLEKNTLALIDKVSKRIFVNTASINQAESVMALLRKSIPAIRITPVDYPEQLAMRFVEWINNPAALPPMFKLASDCLLFCPDDDKKRFNCKGCELPAEEILSLLSQGLLAAELSLIWNERIQFTLTHELILKRIKCQDYLSDELNEIRALEEERQQQDASLVLLAGELRALTNDLLAGVEAVIPMESVALS